MSLIMHCQVSHCSKIPPDVREQTLEQGGFFGFRQTYGYRPGGGGPRHHHHHQQESGERRSG